jgi:hypothetical protein
VNLEHRPTKVLAVGNSGSGKTTYGTRFLAGVDAVRLFVFDHQGELSLRLGLEPSESPEDLQSALERGDGVLLFDPAKSFPGQLPEAFDFFCQWTFEICQGLDGRKVFFVDELQTFVDANNVPENFLSILDTGRRYELDLMACANSPNINPRTRNQLTEVVAFRAYDPRALEFVDAIGIDPDEVRLLPSGSYIARDLQSGVVYRGRIF